MGLVLFGWLSDQNYFKELTSINTLAKLREKTDEEYNEEMLPFGFIDHGSQFEEIIDQTDISYNWLMRDEIEIL